MSLIFNILLPEKLMDLIDNISIVNQVLFSVGLFFIFKKCGIRRIWALIPGFRNYKFAECADMKDDGKVWMASSLFYYLSLFGFAVSGVLFFNDFDEAGIDAMGADSDILLIYVVFLMMIDLVAFIYSVRIYIGVCKLFGKKLYWVPLMILFYGFISVFWGLSKSIVPKFRIADKYRSLVYGSDIAAGKDGLTINIKARIVGNILHKRYLLRDIHMHINPGRMVLLLGGSGAGKTTFINAVTGYEKANANIVLNGQNLYKDFDKMKYEIGFVPQQDLIRYSDTVYHTLSDAAYLRVPENVFRADRKKRVQDVLDIMGLTPVKDNMVGKQSGGQKKRISIASEFISDPSLYVLDEPDSGLDGILAKDLMKRLHDISRQGKIVMVITHSPDRVLDCFDDVIVLAKDENHTGRLVFYGEVEKAKEFFGKNSMEEIIKSINRTEEGGEGRADEFLAKFGGMSLEQA